MQNTIFNLDYNYFFDTKNRANLNLYFKFKNKHDYSFNEDEKNQFKNLVINKINEYINDIDIFIVPETTNKLLLEIVNSFNKEVIILSKNNKEVLNESLLNQNMMKDERKKLFSILDNMDVIKIANIPGNQRKRFINCLFEKIEINKKSILIDDSVFSGYTLLAARNAIIGDVKQNIVFFSK